MSESDKGSDGPHPSEFEEKTRGRKKLQLDEFTLAAVRMQVRELFPGKEIPTVEKVLATCSANINGFPKCRKGPSDNL